MFMSNVVYFCGLIWLIHALRKVYSLFVSLYAYRLRKYFGGPKELSSIASSARYAVVSGATDGIGLAYAKALARLGFSIVLIGRNEDKLKASKDAITDINDRIDVRMVKADFNSNDPDALYDKINDDTEGLEIAVLVNNVGVSYPHMLEFEKIDPKLCDELIRVNAVSVVRMCRLFIPRMLCNPFKSVVINISSYSGISCMPYLSAYAASKAYVTALSRALSKEYSKDNIIIQCVNPLWVATKMSGTRRSSIIVADPNSFVEEAVLSVGVYKECCGCLSHQLQSELVSMIPQFVLMRAILAQKKDLEKRLAAKEAVQHKRD